MQGLLICLKKQKVIISQEHTYIIWVFFCFITQKTTAVFVYLIKVVKLQHFILKTLDIILLKVYIYIVIVGYHIFTLSLNIFDIHFSNLRLLFFKQRRKL